jgi:alpha-galactosidase
MLPFLARRFSSFAVLPILAACALSLPSRAANAQALGAWKGGPLPFSFKYDGKASADFLSSWKKTDQTLPSEGGETHRYTFTDPATSLKIVADVRSYTDFPAVDWVLHFTNESQKDTPLIEDVQPLRWTMPVQDHPVLHWAQGSSSGPDDFAPHDTPMAPGQSAQLNSAGGRSSNNQMPFFSLQDGAQGIFGAIGWTGNWVAHFNLSADGKNMALDAGMQKTHFVLHSGETVRTPRIVLLDWKGDPVEAQNLWRKFVLAHYSPREPDGSLVVVPMAFGQGNDNALGPELKTIQALHDKQVPIEDYWVDATWYGNGGDWVGQRGNWTPDPAKYPPPDGLRALGGFLHGNGYGFILWLEAEAAAPGSDMLTKHPGWYLRNGDPNAQGLLNFGNPEALAGITDLLSSIITQGMVTWYRQDFNVEPEGFWAKNDAPDRVGVTEMKDIEGLYAYWDALRRAHPGLQIDNCASGGRRLDIEAISRSISLWRTDLGCGEFDPVGNQNITQGLNIWVPLNAGVYGAFAPNQPGINPADITPSVSKLNPGILYSMRSGYSAGWLFGTDRLSIDLMKPSGDEFIRVRPYFTGNFYPLTPYSAAPKAWVVWQLDRPDLKSGVLIALRRTQSDTGSMQPALRAIDPNAQYEVETRTSLDPGETKTMSGQDLSHLALNISDKPGSLIVFYKQK